MGLRVLDTIDLFYCYYLSGDTSRLSGCRTSDQIVQRHNREHHEQHRRHDTTSLHAWLTRPTRRYACMWRPFHTRYWSCWTTRARRSSPPNSCSDLSSGRKRSNSSSRCSTWLTFWPYCRCRSSWSSYWSIRVSGWKEDSCPHTSLCRSCACSEQSGYWNLWNIVEACRSCTWQLKRLSEKYYCCYSWLL